MIVTKTPLRISFFGGGSDIPQFYEENEGMVISTAINSYIYLAVNRCVASHLRVIYSELEQTDSVENIKHDRVREVLKHFEITSNIEIASFSDVPTKGTGLGSSSTFTVGLINAVQRILSGRNIDHKELAELASYIEIVKCKEPIGKQDQYASAYGGFNAIYFHGNEVRVKLVDIDPSAAFELDSNLLAFNTGINRPASSILTQQVENLKNKTNIEQTKAMVELAKNGVKLLQRKKIDEFGELLDHGWKVKKMLSDNISNQNIDEMYDRAMKNGALGGKLLGAGGGGYLLVYVQDKYKNRVLEAMKNYERFNFKFAKHGSTLETI
jgi:D-glycero-alpha-D-manno-heptose-7-phosphate kinase